MTAARIDRRIGFFPEVVCRKRLRGRSQIEFIVWVLVFCVIAAVLLERLTRYQEYGEKAAMEITVMNLRSGLRLRMAELMALDRWNEVEKLPMQNPITWTDPRPPNYLGELNNPRLSDIPPGNWYFNLPKMELVYVPDHSRFFEPAPNGEKMVVFQVMSLHPAKTRADGSRTRAEGISFVQKNTYKWTE